MDKKNKPEEKQRLAAIELPQKPKPEDLHQESILNFLPKIEIEPSGRSFLIKDPSSENPLAEYFVEPPRKEELPEQVPSHPIYKIGEFTIPNNDEIYHLPVDIILSRPSEHHKWKPAITLKETSRKEKNLKKQQLARELALIPKDEIWETFKPKEDGSAPEGYRPSKKKEKWWMPGVGNPHAPIWIIGLYPSNEELKSGKVYAGKTGEELYYNLKECGLDPEKDVYMDNMIKCYMPPKSKLSAAVKLAHTWLLKRQLSYYRPEKIICLGAEAFKEIISNQFPFSKTRGTWLDASYPKTNPEEGYPAWEGKVVGTFHPAGCLRSENRHNLELLRHDLKDFFLDRERKDVTPEGIDIKSTEGLEDWIGNEFMDMQKLPEGQFFMYAIDTEGFGESPRRDKLTSIQLCRILAEKEEYQPDYSKETKGTFVTAPKIEVKPIEAQKRVANLIFREVPDPEKISYEVQQACQDSLLPPEEILSREEVPIQKKQPLIKLANSPDEHEEIIRVYNEKQPIQDLVIFQPYKTKLYLANHHEEVGQYLSILARHNKCAGFVLTNANFDRIRYELILGKDFLPTKVHKVPLDTMLAEHIANENGDLGLKEGLNKHFGWQRQEINLAIFEKEHKLNEVAKKNKDRYSRKKWSLFPTRLMRPYGIKDSYGAGALFVHQYQELLNQEKKYQPDRLARKSSNTTRQAFYISCGAINTTYEMNKYGMPVGKKGLQILKELTQFYQGHRERMTQEYKDSVFALTGFRDSNPSSTEELAFVLFNPKSPLARRGIEPWKESGQKGRLWEEIPEEERGNCTPSTDAESLEIIASNCQDPEIQGFLMRLSETKTILTICQDFLPPLNYGIQSKKGLIGRIDLDTLCMHTSYTPTLDTARCRSVPNLTTLLKGEIKKIQKILGEAPPYQIREIIHAPEGHYLLNRDWSTAEVLALGYLSEDTNMLEIISQMSKGMDFHAKLAIPTYPLIQETIELLGKHPTPPNDWFKNNVPEARQSEFKETWEEIAKERAAKNLEGPLTEPAAHKMVKVIFKQERSNIKPVTFGVPYGRTAAAIAKALNREYYVNDVRTPEGEILKVTEKEAQAMIDSYKIKEFHVAWGYLEEQAAQAVEKGYLRDPWGYIRHFAKGAKDETTRKAYNYQIQHLVAAVMNMALADWSREKSERELNTYAYATNYDNIGWVVPENELQEAWDVSQLIMTTNRPVGPKDGEKPELATRHFPTEGEFSIRWEGKTIPLEELGVEAHPELNLTGLEN